jgi:hypothetical protein
LAGGATEQGRASECGWAPEKARARGGCGRKTCCRGRVHDGERERFWGGGTVPTRGANGTERATSERAISVDERGPWDREREGDTRARGVGADSSAPPGSKSGRGMALIGGGHLS